MIIGMKEFCDFCDWRVHVDKLLKGNWLSGQSIINNNFKATGKVTGESEIHRWKCD